VLKNNTSCEVTKSTDGVDITPKQEKPPKPTLGIKMSLASNCGLEDFNKLVIRINRGRGYSVNRVPV
jgi:hypothetical protein